MENNLVIGLKIPGTGFKSFAHFSKRQQQIFARKFAA